MRLITYEIPVRMTVETAAKNMIALAKEESKFTPNEEVKVVAVHNSIKLLVDHNSTVDELCAEWDDKRY